MFPIGSVGGVLIGDPQVELNVSKTREKQVVVKLILNFGMAGDVDSFPSSKILSSLIDPMDFSSIFLRDALKG